MTAAERRIARQNPTIVEAATPYDDQTANERAQISGEGWARMIRRYKPTLGVY